MPDGQRFGLTPRSEYFGTRDPGVNDDASQGFDIGSVWANQTGKKVWVCSDNTTGAAAWTKIAG